MTPALLLAAACLALEGVADTDVVWCSGGGDTDNTECSQEGDAAAQCSDGVCVCGPGFTHPELERRAGLCAAAADHGTFWERETHARIDLDFENGTCARLTNETEALFEEAFLEVYGSYNPRFLYGCSENGSLVVHAFFVTNMSDFAASPSFMDQLASLVEATPELFGVMGGVLVATATRSKAGLLMCDSDGALVTALVNGTCHAMHCAPPAQLVEDDSVYFCKVEEQKSVEEEASVSPWVWVFLTCTVLSKTCKAIGDQQKRSKKSNSGDIETGSGPY